jgi:RimJ/RimL family protein N-acetyltransferase
MLRELAESDVAPLHGVYGNEEATRHLSFEPRTTEQVEGIIMAAMRSATVEPRTEYALAVAGKDGELIGSARLATGGHESGQIGFALRPDQWGQGKGLETVRLLQQLGFRELGLHRIWGARPGQQLFQPGLPGGGGRLHGRLQRRRLPGLARWHV